MKILIMLFLPLFVFAQSYGLKDFISHASKTNGLMKAKELMTHSKQQEVEAAKSAYWPTLDIGADYSFQSPKYVVSPGETGNVFVSANLNLYDGGRKSAILKSKNFLHKASLFEKRAFDKSITLTITKYYYSIQSLQATLHALYERAKELKAQIKRIKKFKLTGLATQEAVDKLLSVYENNQYIIENTKFAIENAQENLKLVSGLSAKHLNQNRFREPRGVHFEWAEPIKILQANANAVGENAKAIDAGYMPQVNLTDTYHKSHFDDLVSMPGGGGGAFLIDHQNKVGLSVNMRVFDMGKMSKESEAVKYQKLALLSQLNQAKKEQRMNFNLARANLRTTRAKVRSARSALKAATSTYKVLKQKFEVGLVDDIAYLDALAQKTLAESRYKASVY
ncbi:MAG: TolC family protein, partial [Sulfurimonas sp.]